MHRVLHIVDSVDRGESLERGSFTGNVGLVLCRGFVRSQRTLTHEVVLLAGTRGAQNAGLLGLPVSARVAPPAGRVELAAPGVRAYLRARGEPDVVMCWGRRAARLSQRLGTRRAVWSELDLIGGELSTRGPGLGGEIGAPVRVAVNPRARPWDGSAGRAALRAEMKCVGAESLVAQVGVPPTGAGAMSLVLGILTVSEIQAVGVVERGSPGLGRTLRHLREGGYIKRLVQCRGPIERLLSGCDAGVFAPAPGDRVNFAGRFGVAWALGRGLPVSAPNREELRDLYPRGSEVCLAPSDLAGDLSRVAHRILSDPGEMAAVRRALLAPNPEGGPSVSAQIVRSWRSVGVIS